MSDASPDGPNEARPQDSWDHDVWRDEDAWARDDWKNADWGEAAAPTSGKPSARPRGGMASYGQGMMEAGPYLTLGLQIAFGMMLFVGIGYLVDQWLGSTPWGIMGGAALGMVAVFAFIIRMARDADSREKARRQREGFSDG